MKLPANDRKKLFNIILESYPDIAEIAMLINLELGENLDNITGGSNNKQKVFNLIKWAETRGKLIDLLQALSKDRPDNVELQTTIQSLQDKYFQHPKNQDNPEKPKKNKLSLFIRYLLGILIIPVGIIGYKSYDHYHRPRLSCNNTELQQQDDSIKIIISKFDGNISPRLENYLYQKFDKLLTSKASKIIVCLTTNTKQKIKSNSDARELGKQLLLTEKQRDLGLIIWLDESTLTGGIEFINDNMPDIPLSFDLDAKNNIHNILDDKFANKVYLFTSYGLSKIFYYKLNKSALSLEYLHSALEQTISCNIEKSKEIDKNQEIARLYFELGLLYESQNFSISTIEAALKSYECGLKIDNNANNIRFQIASVYNKKGEKSKAKLIYTELTNSDRVSSEIKSLSFAQIGILLAKESRCDQAEQEFNKSVASNLSLGLELRAYTMFFDCQKFHVAIEDLSNLCPEIDKDCHNILMSYHKQLFQLERSQQLHIVEELKALRQSQPKWQRIIDVILKIHRHS